MSRKGIFFRASIAAVIRFVSGAVTRTAVCRSGSPGNFTPTRGCTLISAGTLLPSLSLVCCGVLTGVWFARDDLTTVASDAVIVVNFSG